MLTIMKIRKHSHLFSDDERSWLLEALDFYASTEEGEWLNEVKYDDCEYRWCDAMNLDNGVLGARPLFGNDIYLASNTNDTKNPDLVRFWIRTLAPTAIHELRHMWQQDVYGDLLWSVLRLPEVLPCFYGKVLIERDAFAVQDGAEKIIGKM